MITRQFGGWVPRSSSPRGGFCRVPQCLTNPKRLCRAVVPGDLRSWDGGFRAEIEVPERAVRNELEPERWPALAACEPGRGDVLGSVERHQNPVELPLIPLVPIPDDRLFLAVDRDHGLELHHVMLANRYPTTSHPRSAGRHASPRPRSGSRHGSRRGRRSKASDPPFRSRSAQSGPGGRSHRRTDPARTRKGRSSQAGNTRRYRSPSSSFVREIVSPGQDRGQLHSLFREGIVRQNALVGQELDHRDIVDPAPDQSVDLGSVPGRSPSRVSRTPRPSVLRAAVASRSSSRVASSRFSSSRARSVGGRVERGPDSPTDRSGVGSGQIGPDPVREVRPVLHLRGSPDRNMIANSAPRFLTRSSHSTGNPSVAPAARRFRTSRTLP